MAVRGEQRSPGRRAVWLPRGRLRKVLLALFAAAAISVALAGRILAQFPEHLSNEQRVCVERSPAEHRQRWAHGDAPLLVTNHYRHLGPADLCPRYACLERNAARLKGPSAEELLAELATL